MKTHILKMISSNIPVLLVLACFFIFSSLDKKTTEHTSPAAPTNCTKGYDISMADLRQFMLDSLSGIQFEGGVYSRADLINILQSIPGDSVHIMNVLYNCQVAQGTDLAITSPATTIVRFARRKKCIGCPFKPCCPRGVCAVNINRPCVTYTDYIPLTSANENGVYSSLK